MKTEHWTGEMPCNINGFRKTESLIIILRMDVSASEKSIFYNKYIRKMRLEIDDNGILKIKVQ
ncbi:MAG: hypothetical protein U0L73_02445 [Ruminococcus bromii]|nr:hypothetical protein [Ruminococcus bromii]